MWALLSRKMQVTTVVALTLLIKWLSDSLYSLWSNGEDLSDFKIISIATLVIGTIVVWFANRYWRTLWKTFPILEKIIFPDLNGTWQGTVSSTWVGQEGEILPIPITFTIRQSLFSIRIHSATNESPAHSTRCILEADTEAERYRIWYSYNNHPNANVAHRSCRHEGVAWLEMDLGADKNLLRGQYFTDRKTTGDIQINRIVNKLY